MRALHIKLSNEDNRKLGEKADELGIINDLELAEQIIHEWLNKDDSARINHKEN